MITKGLRESGRKEIPNEAITRCWRLLPSDRSGVVGLPLMTLHRALSGFSLKAGSLSKKGKSQLESGVCSRVCVDKHTTHKILAFFCFAALHNPDSIQVQQHHSPEYDNLPLECTRTQTHQHRGSGPHFQGALGLCSPSRSTAVGLGSAVSTKQPSYCPVYCLS